MNLKARLTEVRNAAVGDHDGASAEFARLVGVSRSAISQLLAGSIHSLKAVTALTIQKKTGFSAEWVVLGLGPKKLSEPDLAKRHSGDQSNNNENKLLAIIRAFQETDPKGKEIIWTAAQAALRRRDAAGRTERKRTSHTDAR